MTFQYKLKEYKNEDGEYSQYLPCDKREIENIIHSYWTDENLPNELELIVITNSIGNQEFDVYSVNGLSDIINNPDEFKNRIQLRPDSELNDMENELYDQHWRVRDAQLFGKEMPSELNPSIERRYGLSWLVGWGDDWDDVPTDT